VARYLIRRAVELVPLLFLATLAVFVVLQLLPAGPLSVYENDPDMTSEDIARLEERFGLHEPIPLRYARWLGTIAQGDLGYSLVTHQPVGRMIAERLPNTFVLMGLALLVTLAIALPIGVLSATRQYSWIDHAATLFSFVGYAMPPFWSGLLAILLFSVTLRLLPATGHLLMPVAVLALFNAAHYTRYVRSSMLEVLGQEYVRTARAKGLRERAVVWRHALKNAALPVVTVVTLDLPQLFAGAVVTESVFAWPGMGRLFLESAYRFDYPVLMGVVTITAVLVMLSTLLADVLYAALDPRVRLS
jgi:peptide/nickel transport system permease protein